MVRLILMMILNKKLKNIKSKITQITKTIKKKNYICHSVYFFPFEIVHKSHLLLFLHNNTYLVIIKKLKKEVELPFSSKSNSFTVVISIFSDSLTIWMSLVVFIFIRI